MLLYLFPIFFLLFLEKINANRKIVCLFLLYLMFFICFGYMCGSDWRSYEMIYSDIEIEKISYFLLFYEPGFLLYTLFFKFIGFDFWEFHVLTKVFVFWIFVYHLYYFLIDKKDVFLSLTLFLSSAGYFFFIDCPFRNLIAWGIVLFSFKYLFRRKFWHFLLIVVLSSSFHTSMLFLVPIYWISNLKLSTRQYVFIYILFFVSFSSREVIMTLLYPMTLIHPILLSRFDSYSEVSDVSAASGYSLGLLVQLLYFFLFVRQHDRFVAFSKYGNCFFNLTFLYFVFYRIALVIPVLSRFQFDLNIFYIVSLPFIIENFTNFSKLIFKYIVYILSALFIIVSVTSTTKYLPYTNYIYYKITLDLHLSITDKIERINL